MSSLVRERHARLQRTAPQLAPRETDNNVIRQQQNSKGKSTYTYPGIMDGKENHMSSPHPAHTASAVMRVSDGERRAREQAGLAEQRKQRLLQVREQEKEAAARLRQKYREQLIAQRQDAGRRGRDQVLQRRRHLLSHLQDKQQQHAHSTGMAHRQAAEYIADQGLHATHVLEDWSRNEDTAQSRFEDALSRDREAREAAVAEKRHLMEKRERLRQEDREKAARWAQERKEKTMKKKEKEDHKRKPAQPLPTATDTSLLSIQEDSATNVTRGAGTHTATQSMLMMSPISHDGRSPIASVHSRPYYKEGIDPPPNDSGGLVTGAKSSHHQASFQAMTLRKAKENDHYVSTRRGLFSTATTTTSAVTAAREGMKTFAYSNIQVDPVPTAATAPPLPNPTSADLPLSQVFHSHPFPALELSAVSEVAGVEEPLLRHEPVARALAHHSQRGSGAPDDYQRDDDTEDVHGRRSRYPAAATTTTTISGRDDERTHRNHRCRAPLTQGVCVVTRPPVSTVSHVSVEATSSKHTHHNMEESQVPTLIPAQDMSIQDGASNPTTTTTTTTTTTVQDPGAAPLGFDVPLLPRLAGDSAAGTFLTSFMPSRHRPSFAHPKSIH